jgi:hypothetical protein
MVAKGRAKKAKGLKGKSVGLRKERVGFGWDLEKG